MLKGKQIQELLIYSKPKMFYLRKQGEVSPPGASFLTQNLSAITCHNSEHHWASWREAKSDTQQKQGLKQET